MTIEVSDQVESRLRDEAQRQGISMDALLERMVNERCVSVQAEHRAAAELPVRHLGPMGPLHRRDIYGDVR